MYTPDNFFKFDDASLNYKIEGSGAKNILFLHGFALSLQSWDLIIERIDKSEYRCISVDLNGFGFSRNMISEDYSIERQALLILKLLESIGVNEIFIVSHSYGGVITLFINFLITNKQTNLQIVKEVLIDVPAFNEAKPGFIKILQGSLSNLFFFRFIPSDIIAKYIIKTTFFEVENALKLNLKRYSFFLKQDSAKKCMTLIAKQVLPLQMDEFVNSYVKIYFPVLILWGEMDTLIPVKYGFKLASKIQGSEIILLQNCGHVPHEECPQETFEAINNFLKSI